MPKISNFPKKLVVVEIISDTLAIIMSFILGHLIWIKFAFFGKSQPFEIYGGIILYAVPILLLSFKNAGLYKQQMGILHIRELVAVIQGVTIGFLIIFAVSFFARQINYSRLATVFAFVLCFFSVSLERLIIIKLLQRRRERGKGMQNIAIFGTCEVAKKFAKKIVQTPKFGYRIVGFLSMEEREGKTVTGSLKVIGSLDNAGTIIDKYGIGTIFICLPKSSENTILDIVQACNDSNITFKIVPNMYQFTMEDISFENIDGIPVISIKYYEPKKVYPVFKRICDFCLALFLIVILFPLGIIIFALIKIDSKGPALFKQKRVREGGKVFAMLKFRTMDNDTKKYAYTPTSHSDSRITRLGKHLRKLSLDELPQLINILKGEMSFVGPRPEMPFIVKKYNKLQRYRLKVRPGLTGLWQISHDRAIQVHENMDYDLFYIENQSFLLDMAIFLRTFSAVFNGKGAW